MAKVLIIDDDQKICEMLSCVVRRKGCEVTCAYTLEDGLKKAASEAIDVAFLDVQMPDGNGLDMLPKLRATSSSPEVIIITGAGDPDGAELAIKCGAWDYLEKPSAINTMTVPLIRALQYRQEKIAAKPAAALKLEGIIGNSPQMRACFDLLAQAAGSEAGILITGETGTGKELFAHAIHENSRRAQNNFVVVDCTALPETLVESVLFGYEKGAFTGADKSSDGLIRQADGGTLFLDEVGELPLSLQKTFLRVLQEHHFRPLGGKHEIASDFRLVAATNRDLDRMVQDGQFRQDLLFRLRSFIIELPALRNRAGDIRELARYHLDRLCNRYEMATKEISPEFFDVLDTYTWPGNVRELVNTLERTLAAAGYNHILFPKHLPTYIRVHAARALLRKETQTGEEARTGEGGQGGEKGWTSGKARTGEKGRSGEEGRSEEDVRSGVECRSGEDVRSGVECRSGEKAQTAVGGRTDENTHASVKNQIGEEVQNGENARTGEQPHAGEKVRSGKKAQAGEGKAGGTESSFPGEFPKLGDFRAAMLAEAERRYLHDLMSFSGNNIKDACRMSGLSRSRLYALLKQHKSI